MSSWSIKPEPSSGRNLADGNSMCNSVHVRNLSCAINCRHNSYVTAKIVRYFFFLASISPRATVLRRVTNEWNKWCGYWAQWNIEVSRALVATYNAYSVLWRQRHVYSCQTILAYRSMLRRVVAFGINIGQYLSHGMFEFIKICIQQRLCNDAWKVADTKAQLVQLAREHKIEALFLWKKIL